MDKETLIKETEELLVRIDQQMFNLTYQAEQMMIPVAVMLRPDGTFPVLEVLHAKAIALNTLALLKDDPFQSAIRSAVASNGKDK